jgi:hypothetical protein
MTDHITDDPFATETNADDPFAASEDIKTGGVYVPRPPVEILEGRLIVMVPRSFDKEAKVSDYLQEKGFPAVREEWTIDLVVLNGAPMEYTYRSKKDGTENEYEEKTMKVDTFPFLVPGFKVSWANIIGSLNKLASSPKPFGLGHIRGGYSAKEMRNGKTFDMFADEMKTWEDKVRTSPRSAGEKPRAKWHFVISDDAADRALALSWWNVAKAEGFRVS